MNHESRNELANRLDLATQGLAAPLAVVDVRAFDANADQLAARAAGTPIRVASKSVRCRALLRRVLDRPEYAGILAFTLAEALWLRDNGFDTDDIVVGYPSVDRASLQRLASDQSARDRIAIMVDDPAQVRLLLEAAPAWDSPVRICLDVDASLRLLGDRVHLGARRSPVRQPEQAADLVRELLGMSTPEQPLRVVGLMSYEAQVAGVGDNPDNKPRGAVIRAMQRRSVSELVERRAAVVAAVEAELDVANEPDLEFVNAGGTGSIESSIAEPWVTEVAAGSGLFAPRLFDTYRAFHPEPAAFFGLDVVRRPAADIVTVAGGGYIASGAVGPDRAPTPYAPAGLSLDGTEGAGEVQTPLKGATARALAIGDRVWFRHAKAGEMLERFDQVHLVEGDRLVGTVPSYRGDGQTFL